MQDSLHLEYGLPKDKIELIYPGVDFSENYPIVRSVRKWKSEFVVGTMMRMSEEKGGEYFVRAIPGIVKEIPHARFVLGGAGVEEENLNRLVDELCIRDKVRFLGWINKRNRFMNQIDIFVMPSIREAFGLTLIEALSYKKPVIASEIGGIKELITNGETGLLVRCRDYRRIAGAVVELYRNPESAVSMAERGFEMVASGFNLEEEARKIIKLY
jgi:glycosyltransferase involved in cell wall biosynthesis